MASNKELRATATEIADELKIDLGDISQQSNAILAALVKDLRAKKADAETSTAADTAEPKADEPKADEPKADEPKAKGFCVAKGRAITATGSRTLGGGDAVSAADLSGGEEAFEALKKAGLIVA